MYKRQAIYCRLSEEDADKADPGQDSRSIQNQKSMLVRFGAVACVTICLAVDVYKRQACNDQVSAGGKNGPVCPA